MTVGDAAPAGAEPAPAGSGVGYAARGWDLPAAQLFAPAPWKLAALFVTSFGAYGMYWFYRNWIALRLLSRQPGISPVWRAAFAPVWVFACFDRLGGIAGHGLGGRAGSAALATAFLASGVLGLGQGGGLLAVALGWLPLSLVNARLRRFKRVQGIPFSRREGPTALSLVWLCTGGALMVLALAGVLLLGPLHGPG